MSELAQQNGADMNRVIQCIEDNAIAIDRLAARIESLTAASERHDRILDYLLSREAENENGGNG